MSCKVVHLVKDKIKTVYVFNGQREDDGSINKIFPDVKNIVYTEQQIHYDDSIREVKVKILNELSKTMQISVEELYLFCKRTELLSTESIYQSLTRNREYELVDYIFAQAMSNIVSDRNGNPIDEIPDKSIITPNDLLDMKLNDTFTINKVLGQKEFIVEGEVPITVNPFNAVATNKEFDRMTTRFSLMSLDNQLVLNSGIDEDSKIIYLCTARDVLETPSVLSERNLLKMYYPFLYDKNINSLEDLDAKSPELIEKNDDLLNDKTLSSYDKINMFYDIFSQKDKEELKYENKGIKFVKAVIRPTMSVNIPVEAIFKIVHATQRVQIIKYNPSERQENIYRIYADKTATNGSKIPYLDRHAIFKIIKTRTKTRSVTVFIEHSSQKITCEFDETGFITISSEFTTAIDEEVVNTLFRDSINPIIGEIKLVLEQSGYKLSEFTSLKNVEVQQMTYEVQYTNSKFIRFNDIAECVSSAFVIESSDYKTETQLRLKRVANFNKMTSQEAFIIERLGQGYRGEEIVDLLYKNYRDEITYEAALSMVTKIANETKVERGLRKSDIKVQDNPGFKTTFLFNQMANMTTITIENINDINYLVTIPIYLESIIRITHNKTSYNVAEMCRNKQPVDIKKKVTRPVESPDTDDSIDPEKKAQLNRALNKFLQKTAVDYEDEDEDEDEDDEFEGGASNSDSSVEIPSPIYESEQSSPGIPSPEEESSPEIESPVAEEESSPEIESPVAEEESSPEIESPVAEEEFSPEIESPVAEEEPSPAIASPVAEEESSPAMESPVAEKETSPVMESPVAEKETTPVMESTTESSIEIAPKAKQKTKQIIEDKQIDGMRMKNPTYFQTRIQERDPILIKTEDTLEYNSYSRICKADVRRQPIILNDDELKKVNDNHKGFLRPEDVVTYGSNKDKKFHYICPRYWCLKTNTVIDPSEMKEVIENGKKILVHPTCGKILPPNETYVKPGHYVYEFYSPTKQKPNYKRYPGFQENSHPDGYCLPCCFDFHNTPGVTQVKNRCLGKVPIDDKKKQIDEDDYVKGPEKFPLETGRWGYLQIGVQKLLREDNSQCQISNKNKKLKVGHPCLLRHGVETSDKQSFLACMSDLIFYAKALRVPTIMEFKRLLMNAITVDEFIKYQNGNLVTKFQNDQLVIDINKYNNTVLFTKLNMEKPEDKVYFKKVISAYENFRDFINSKDAVIDHTYLWDIVCMPNKQLFPAGANLVILQIPNNDITNNIQIICPSNHYSNELYDTRKPTIFLVKIETYYEPIYSYTDNKKKINIEKSFMEKDNHVSKSMKVVLNEVIKPFFDTICRPFSSIPPGMRTSANVYTSTKPLLLSDLVKQLDALLYKTVQLVVNYNNKVIGVVAESRTPRRGFVPCYPSAIDESLKKDLTYVFMSDPSLWHTYDHTVSFLRILNTNSNNKGHGIPCKPMFKIVEDEQVVGILTETNQFIQLSEPIAEIDIKVNEDIPSIKNDNYIVNIKETPMVSADVAIATSQDIDTERVDAIKRIRMESSFYNVFRNTIRILLTDYKNTKQKEKIETIMKSQSTIYSNKLKEIGEQLRILVGDKVQFIGDDKYYKLISDVSTCIVKDSAQCSSNTRLCAVSSDGECSMILPKHNLLTKKENYSIYFSRMADELIRYSRIKSFMLKPQTYLSFGNISYNLRDNEIVMLQSLLTKEYFDLLVPDVSNKFVSFNTRDDATPLITQLYENKVTINEGDIDESVSLCKKKAKNWITATIWKKAFPQSFKEIDYGSCSFEILIDIYEKKNGVRMTISQIKDDLAKEYETKYLNNFKDKVVDILQMEGKKTLGEQVQNGVVQFSSLLYDEKYYLSPFDLWILVQKYEIPTIFISQQTILQTGYKEYLFVGYDGHDDKFAFIVIPVLKTETIPNYKLVISEDEDTFINFDQITDSSKINEAILSTVTPTDFLTNFTKEFAVKPKKKRIQKQIVVASSSTSSLKRSSSSSLDIDISPGTDTKKRKVATKKPNTKTKKKQ
jgi:hypothetical protein